MPGFVAGLADASFLSSDESLRANPGEASWFQGCFRPVTVSSSCSAPSRLFFDVASLTDHGPVGALRALA